MKKYIKKKFISIVLVFMTLFTYILLPEYIVYGAISYIGQTVVGNYTISTKEQLNMLSQKVNSGNTYAGSTFTLSNNITYDSSTTNNYTPIGKIENPFKGKFDGGGFSIGGISIDNNNLSNAGVFGYIDNTSIVNLSLINSTIKALNNIGGIVGNAQNSIIENCVNNSEIRGLNTRNDETTGIIGGIVGYGYSTSIINCTNSGKIYGLNIGGIVGELKGTNEIKGVFNSTNNGIIEHWSSNMVNYNFRSGGGIVGRATNINIKNCKNMGNVMGSGDLGGTGGIVGVGNNIKIYYSANSSFKTCGGGITGYINNSLIYGCINTSTVFSETNVGYYGSSGGITSIASNSEITYSASRISDIFCTGSYWNAEIVSGGIVGKASNVNINYSYAMSNINEYAFHDNSGGRFSHITYLGGIVGLSSGNVNIKNSYTAGLVKKDDWRPDNFRTYAYPVGGANINTFNAHYLNNNTIEQEYTHIGQNQTVSYMKSQAFVDTLNVGTGGTSEKDIKNPFVKTTTQNSGYPIFWYEQKIESMVIDGASSVAKDDTIILKVITVPENITGKEISWTTSDSSIAEILSVGNGKSIILKGVRKGSVIITAKATDGSNKVVTKTINVVSGFVSSKANYILVGEKIEYRVGWKDAENDPLYKEQFRYIHTPDKFNGTVMVDNEMGLVNYNNQWQNNKYTHFSKVGTYKIQYRVQDNPPTANISNFENYRYYSNFVENTIYVHRKPIAMYTIAINGTSLADYSYDLDHSITHGTKGIAKWEWKCISNNGDIAEYTETNKTTGVNKVNSWISTYRNLGYKIVLRVQDIEGAWSEPCIKGVGEYSKPIAFFTIDKNPMIYSKDTQTITDMSYDTNGLGLTYNWTVIKNGTNILSSTSNNISTTLNQKIQAIYPNITGIYDVSLIVTNSAGISSNVFTKSFEVMVENSVPTINFNLVSNQNPAWTFPKNLGLYTLRYRPTNTLFSEEYARFDTYINDPNTDNTGFLYNWKLERFAVKDINNISGAATNTYNYTTQFPFVNSFKNQGLGWGAYKITFKATDIPPIPPYQSTDAKSAEITKYYYIVPEISLDGNFESSKSEIMVGDSIKLKAKTNKMTDTVGCNFNSTDYALSKVYEDSNYVYWEKNITIPESITESGTYQLLFVGKTTYGGNGNVTREIKDTVPIDIVALKLVNFRITNIVNHPYITFPYTKNMLLSALIPYKTGYYVTFQIDSKGKPDNVYGRIDVENNGIANQVINMTKVVTGDTETWQGRFYSSAHLPVNTIISIKLDCSKGSVTYDYNDKENWDGGSLITEGSALQDGRVNLTN